jgi:hypothetical protein
MRDNFPAAIKKILAERENYHCSNPECRRPTSGPHIHPAKTVNVGVAAHLTAASPGGPRFDVSLSAEQRRSAENGIWLCQKCAKLADNDPLRYTLEVLQSWKRTAETIATSELEGNAAKEPHPVGISSPPWPKDQGVYISSSSETTPLFTTALSGYRATGNKDYWDRPFDTKGSTRIGEGNGWEPIYDFPLSMNHCSDGVWMIRWRSANPDVLIAAAIGYHYLGEIYDTQTGKFGHMQGTNCEEPLFKFASTLNGNKSNLVDVYYELKFWQAAP